MFLCWGRNCVMIRTMIKNSSFRLANALLGLFVIILPFLGLTNRFKTTLLVIFGLLIILFSLAEVGGPDRRRAPEASSEDESAVPKQ